MLILLTTDTSFEGESKSFLRIFVHAFEEVAQVLGIDVRIDAVTQVADPGAGEGLAHLLRRSLQMSLNHCSFSDLINAILPWERRVRMDPSFLATPSCFRRLSYS